VVATSFLDRACAALPPKARVGLVGRNGASKSSLLKLIAGINEPDDGSIETPSGLRIGYVAQEAPGGKGTPFDTVLTVATERSCLLDEVEHATDPHRIGEIHDRLNAIDAHGARPGPRAFSQASASMRKRSIGRSTHSQEDGACGWRLRRCCSRSQISCCSTSRRTISISRRRCGSNPFFKSYRASLIVVSHERDLLNSVAEHILHLNRGRLSLYPGDYDSFARQRREREAQTEDARAAQEAKAKKLQAYVDR
jgi:ATP-binding cassette subfamily F protein 3